MGEHDLYWPKKGDKAFKPCVPSAEQARLEAFLMPTDDLYLLGFRRAADAIVDKAKTDDQNPNDLFFPVAYLYRHHLELSLKEIVRLGVRLGPLDDCKDILGEHNLHKLWNKVKKVIKDAWPDSPDDDLKAVEHVILEFHKLDPSGQAFRYARDRNGGKHLKGVPNHVDLGNLKGTVGAVSDFLEAAWTGIDYCDPGPF